VRGHAFTALRSLRGLLTARRDIEMARRILAIVSVLYIVGLAVVAFWPVPVDRGFSDALEVLIVQLQTDGLPFLSYSAIEIAANVVLFVPLGILLSVLFRVGARWLAFAVCVAISAFLEFGQAVLLPQRVASVSDLLANIAGAAIGVLIVAIVSAVRGRASARAKLTAP
jgi:glycopeptide antibiotics resistance protein